MRATAILFGALILALAIPVHAAAKFKYTHTISVTGGLENDWTVTDAGACAAQGPGSIRMTMKTRGRKRIRPFISRTAARAHSNKPGSWVLGVPGGGGVTHAGPIKATSTLTRADNTSQNPPDNPDDPCDPPNRSACGTTTSNRAQITVGGIDKKWVVVDMLTPEPYNLQLGCLSGMLEEWQRPVEVVGGGNEFGELRLRMPSARALRRKHSITISGRSEKSSTGSRGPENYSDKVVRHAEVTFTKL